MPMRVSPLTTVYVAVLAGAVLGGAAATPATPVSVQVLAASNAVQTNFDVVRIGVLVDLSCEGPGGPPMIRHLRINVC